MKPTVDFCSKQVGDFQLNTIYRSTYRFHMSSIKTTKAWTVHGTDGFENLKFNEQFPLGELIDHDVLIRLHAVSLNYRDVAIPKVRLRSSL